MGRPRPLDQRPALQSRVPRLSHQLRQPRHELQRRRRQNPQQHHQRVSPRLRPATASAINNGIYFGNPIRLPYAGEAGTATSSAATATSTSTPRSQRAGTSATGPSSSSPPRPTTSPTPSASTPASTASSAVPATPPRHLRARSLHLPPHAVRRAGWTSWLESWSPRLCWPARCRRQGREVDSPSSRLLAPRSPPI
jgi:hypothetical protein